MTCLKRVATDTRHDLSPVCIVLCGPSGVGKTTIGEKLAERFCIAYEEGDKYHSDANIYKMSQGIPLNDEDRSPWLERLRDEVITGYMDKGRSVVLACSALKKSYRNILCGRDQRFEARSGNAQQSVPVVPLLSSKPDSVFFVMLIGPVDLIAHRLAMRRNHFMPASLLCTQFSILEPLQLQNKGGLDGGAEAGMIVDLSKVCDTGAVVDAIEERLLRDYGLRISTSDSEAVKEYL